MSKEWVKRMGGSHAKVAMPMSLLGSVGKSSRRRDLVEVSGMFL